MTQGTHAEMLWELNTEANQVQGNSKMKLATRDREPISQNNQGS